MRKDITMRKRQSCDSCDGAGGSGAKTCATCHGQGAVRETKRTPFGMFATTVNCPRCGGSGQTFEKTCDSCDGSGAKVDSGTVKVEIPPGVEDGMRLRVAGEGDAGIRNGGSGDLYVFISIEEHDYFTREGDDLHLEVPISFVQAARGDEIEVPTLQGKATLKIPAGTQTGTIFRLRGKGMPILQSSRHGDELIEVTVEVPEKLSSKQKKALDAFASASGSSVKPQEGFFKKIFK